MECLIRAPGMRLTVALIAFFLPGSIILVVLLRLFRMRRTKITNSGSDTGLPDFSLTEDIGL